MIIRLLYLGAFQIAEPFGYTGGTFSGFLMKMNCENSEAAAGAAAEVSHEDLMEHSLFAFRRLVVIKSRPSPSRPCPLIPNSIEAFFKEITLGNWPPVARQPGYEAPFWGSSFGQGFDGRLAQLTALCGGQRLRISQLRGVTLVRRIVAIVK